MSKSNILQQVFGEQIVGGTLSELATYADLFARLGDSIFLLDLKNYSILEANPAVEKTFHISPDQIPGSSILHWVQEDSRSLVEKKLIEAKNSNSAIASFDADFLTHSQDKITIELVICRLKLKDYCEVIQVIAKDVTEMRRTRQELESMNKILSQISLTDEMTGLRNFRAFRAELTKAHQLALRYHKKYSVIFCDVDHFKKYNDQNGHPAGDDILRGVARILTQTVRSNIDFPARYGGEEFVVLCPETASEQAFELAERVRKNIEMEAFPHREKQPLGFLSVSIGVASFPIDGETEDQVVEAADLAVYASKEGGRNRVTLFHKKLLKQYKKTA